MFRLSKRVEYGLMALQHLAKSGNATTREISAARQIPYDLLAKVMQSLKRDGIVDSYQGAHGGYAMLISPGSVNLSRVMNALDEDTNLAECMSTGISHEQCSMYENCTIKDPLNKLQMRMEESVGKMTIAELL
ncbi:MAG: Rrf2 family transcriptional regulator [bacterium]